MNECDALQVRRGVFRASEGTKKIQGKRIVLQFPFTTKKCTILSSLWKQINVQFNFSVFTELQGELCGKEVCVCEVSRMVESVQLAGNLVW